MKKLLPFVCAVLAVALPARAEKWVKVTTPNFTVISDGSERQARDVALGFEQIRAVFSLLMPGLRTDSGAEAIVIACTDENCFKQLLPGVKEFVAGEFRKGWEKDFILVRLDLPDQTHEIVYHEYIHKLLHLNFTRLPTWLDEGLAEFFANTQFHSNETLIGTISPRIRTLQSRTPFPVAELLTKDPAEYYKDEFAGYMFYAESWGLTHFLMFGDGMGTGQKMNAYLDLLQQGQKSDKAFEKAFGDIPTLDAQFRQYFLRFSFGVLQTKKPLNVDPSQFSGGPMAPAETAARLGNFYTYSGHLDTAEQKLNAALTTDSQSALAHEDMAFLHFKKGEDDLALNEFDQAVKLNSQSYLAAYYQAMLRFGSKTDPDSLSQLDDALSNVVKLNPRFAPAFIERSQILVAKGKLQDAYNVAVQAQRLEPDRGGYATHVAAILLLGRNYPAAIKLASSVAERWTVSDSAEALAVVSQAQTLSHVEPSEADKAKEADEMQYATGLTAFEGTLATVTCEKSKVGSLVVQNGDKMMNFNPNGGFGAGFSDTLWYGADHFSLCHHIQGMHVVARYKPAADANSKDQLHWLEIRDPLIPVGSSSH